MTACRYLPQDDSLTKIGLQMTEIINFLNFGKEEKNEIQMFPKLKT